MNRAGIDIDMFLYNYFPMDIRPRKEALSLSNEGHRIRVYCLRQDNDKKHEVLSGAIEGFRILEVTIPKRNSILKILYFWFLIIRQ